MEATDSVRTSAAAGFAALACGAGAVALERPWPSTSSPAELAAFIADNRAAILSQSMLFVISAGLFMWFLGGLRSYLIEREKGTGRLSSLGFAAGMVAYGLDIVGQAPQITVTLHATGGVDPTSAATFTDLGYVILVVANVPLAVMFVAVAVVSLRSRAFPNWLGWIAASAGFAALLMSFSVVEPNGPLAPQGWLSYLLYLAPIVWLVPAATVMIRAVPADRDSEIELVDGAPRPS